MQPGYNNFPGFIELPRGADGSCTGLRSHDYSQFISCRRKLAVDPYDPARHHCQYVQHYRPNCIGTDSTDLDSLVSWR